MKLSQSQKDLLRRINIQPESCVEYWPPAKALLGKGLAEYDDGRLFITDEGRKEYRMISPTQEKGGAE